MPTGFAYVPAAVSGDVYVVDESPNPVHATIATGPGNNLIGVAVSPDGTFGYTCDQADDQVFPLDLVANTAGTPIGFGGTPKHVAIKPDGTEAWVTLFGGTTVKVINTSTNLVTHTITGLNVPWGVCFNSTGTKAYVTNDVNPGSVAIIDTSTYLVSSTVSLGANFPRGLVITSDDSKLYICVNATAEVVIFDTATMLPTGTITTTGGGSPQELAITPDNLTIWCVSNTTTVNILDTSTMLQTGTYTTPHNARGIAFSADGSTAYIANTVDLSIVTVSTVTLVTNLATGGTSAQMVATSPAAGPPPITRTVTTFVLAGDPGPHGYAVKLSPTPQAPVPGPFGNHDYEVVVCDKYGINYGVIPTAVPTQVDYILDNIWTAQIDFAMNDPPAASLLPIKYIPGVREIQIWRDQVLIWWGWPVAATWDTVQVHLACQGLLFPFSRREIGPEVIHEVTNPQF